MGETNWAAISALAAKQSGLVTREQVLAAGITGSAWDWRVRRGVIRALHRGLFEVAPPETFEDRELRTALLLSGEGAVLSHRTAARLHSLWGFDGPTLEVTVPQRARFAVPGLTIHRGKVVAEDRTDVRGWPATTLVRTLVDLSGQVDTVQLAAAVESARRYHPKLVGVIRDRLDSVTKLVSVEAAESLERVLDDCDSRVRAFDSVYEVEFWHRWLFLGLDRPEPQFQVRDSIGNMYIDFAFPNEKVAIETQGYAVRQTAGSFNNDSARTSRLLALGWIVLPVAWTLFRRQFGKLVERIETIRRDRRGRAK